jgi:hypothetical protein
MIEVKALSTKGRLFRWAVTQGIAASDDSRNESTILVSAIALSGNCDCSQDSCRILVRRVPEIQVGNTHRTSARGETTDFGIAPRRVSDSPLLYHLRLVAWCRAARRSVQANRSRQWSVQRPSASMIQYETKCVKRNIFPSCRMFGNQ